MKRIISLILTAIISLTIPYVMVNASDAVSAPEISVKNNYVTVKAQQGESIYYTLGGENPYVNGILYEEPFLLETINSEIRAIAVKAGVVSEEAVLNFATDDKFENNKASLFGGKSDERFNRVRADKDGFVVVGHADSSSYGNGELLNMTTNGIVDALIIKYDNSGNIVWQKNFGGKNSDFFEDVCITDDGYVAVGYAPSSSFGTGDFSGVISKGSQDAVIAKFDKDGNLLWTNNFGGKGNDYFYGVTADADGYIAVGASAEGSFTNGDLENISSKGSNDAIIVKYDKDGNVVWTKTFGGYDFDNFRKIENDSDGYIVVGDCSEASFGGDDWVDFENKGLTDAIIVKYNKDGKVIWKQNFGGYGSDYFEAVTFDETGYVTVGNNYDSDGQDWGDSFDSMGWLDAIIVKYDKYGNLLWRERFGGSDSDSFYDVTAEDGGYIVTGYAGADSLTDTWGDLYELNIPKGEGGLVLKYNRDGENVWLKHFPSTRQGVAVNDSGFATVGYVTASSLTNVKWENETSRGGIDAVFEKFDYMPLDISYKYAQGETGKAGVSGKNTVIEGDNFLVPVYFTPQKEAVGINIKLTYPSYISFVKNMGEYNSVYISESKDGDMKTLTISADFSLEKGTVKENELCIGAVLNFKLEEEASLGESVINVDGNETFMVDASFTPTAFEKLGNYTFQIIPVPVKELYISGKSEITGVSEYSITTFPENAANKNVKWSVLDETRGEIDSNGILTPFKNGEITIKAISEDGSTEAELTVMATGIKTYIDTLTSDTGEFAKEYTANELNRTLYVPADAKSVKLKSTFKAGSISSDYGLFFSGIEKSIALDTIPKTIVLTKKEADCDDTVYTLTIKTDNRCIESAEVSKTLDNVTEVNVKFKNAPKGVLCTAVYKNGELKGITTKDITAGQEDEKAEVKACGDTVKLMLFEDMLSIKPLCDPYIMDIQ